MAGIKILCFGDSLTSGYFNFGLGEHPYAETLAERLRATFPFPISVKVSGVPGDLVCTERWVDRAKAEFEKDKYTWAIVLGGTNDIAFRIPADEIFQCLSETWDMALCKGTRVLALTVPECRSKMQFATDTRNELNDLIRKHKEHNFYTFDLHGHLPYHSLTREQIQKYWDDGLHLTEEGYNWMGEHIADALIKIIQAEAVPKPATTSRPERRKRKPKVYGDEASIEEEEGDPKRLSKGYVVVRKRDLE